MTRIAFTLIGGKTWTGGYNYLINLLRVVTRHQPDALQPVLFLGTDVDPDDAQPFKTIEGVEIITSVSMNSSRRSASLLRSVFLGADPAIRRLFNQHRINVVFENAQFHGARLGIPAIAWIPDFQHRELPHLFSRAAWWKRELGFRAQIAGGRTIMLSSEDSRDTCERHYPAAIGRTHVVRFAVPLVSRPDALAVRAVREAYSLPERYIYLPNQFWQHKNHLLVIEALALLKQAGQSIVVAASGKQLDPCKPEHFSRITARLATAGVTGEFRLLGLIPYEHIAPLMVGSVAVLNPSLFEGWSTAVEEARALRVPLVLSDLPVHKEQATGIARFFNRFSADSLAEALLAVWQGERTVATDKSFVPNQEIVPVQRFAKDFIDLVRYASSQHHQALKITS
jgi:glycosyltransferase involved in cell wall biosynthesis